MRPTRTSDRFTGDPAAIRRAFDEAFEDATGRSLTLRSQAAQLGVAHSTLSQILSGQKPHSARFVHGLLRLGFTADTFERVQRRATNLTAAARRSAKRAA